MIDSYLKTSMPIYDSIDRQNHRNGCCINEQFRLYTDLNHMPPFQLYIPNFDINITDFRGASTFNIYDIQVFPAAMNNFMINGVNYYSDGTNTWIIYDGIALADVWDIATLGNQFYINLRFRVDPPPGHPITERYWVDYYTEVFTVCDCGDLIPGVLSEELLLNGDFSAWAGDNPSNWIVTGEVANDPEVCEVAPNQSHANCGVPGGGACNIYTTANVIDIRPTIDILTIGKTYLIEIEVTKFVSGSIYFYLGTNGINTWVSESEGVYRYIETCDGIDGRFVVRRGGMPCDVTIDNVSVKRILTENSDYYSEVFTVCDCDLILNNCDNEVLSVYDTDQRGAPDEIIKRSAAFGPMVYWYNNKSYCCWLQRGGAGYCSESMVYAVDHGSCHVSKSYGVGPPRSAQGDCATDDHAVPVIIVADDKHIVVAHERLTGIGDPAHNGYMQIKRSDNEEDESSWVNAIAHNTDYFDEKGDEVNNRLSYPSFDKLANSKLFLICRHSSAGELNRVSVHRSVDHGINWNDLGGSIDGGYDIVDLSATVTLKDLTYKGLCKHPYDNNLYLMIYWYDDTKNNPDLYFLKCEDGLGEIWQSVDGAHSQDITAGGGTPITKAVLDNPANHYLVKHCADPEGITSVDGVITNDGIPYIATIKGTPPAYKPFIYYWNGAAWVENDMGFGFSDAPTFVIFERANSVMEIIIADQQNGTFNRSIYQSTNMTTWSLIKNIYSDIKDAKMMDRIAATFNYTVADCEVFEAMTNRDAGNYSDFYLFYECADAFTICNMLSLTWWHECDFDGIIYQYGYKNRMILDARLEGPRAEITKPTKERKGHLFSEYITHKEFFNIKIILSRYAFYALNRLPLYADNNLAHVILTLPNGDWAEIYEMTIDATWQTANCYAEFVLDFIQGELVITNCCEEYAVSEQIFE